MYYFVKTTNPRPTFHLDMTPVERETMVRHVEYWTGFAKRGNAIAFGPVIDPSGPYGILVARFENQDELKAALAGDPAKNIFGYSWATMGNLVSEKMVLG